MNARYKEYYQYALRTVGRNNVYADPLRCLAWGTDAGFYRLIPKMVVRAQNEAQVQDLLRKANVQGVPVTFRAAGTALSGQSISDSVLIVAGKHWEKMEIAPDGSQVTLEPGVVGHVANQRLAPYGRKLGPDPASIKSAMLGGIVMNNASGMNCGVHENSDRMMLSARIVLADGTLLDTGSATSRREFAQTHERMLNAIAALRDRVRANTALADRIRYKYSIKNVTGLNLLPLIVHDDPFDIIAHLLVGSEGTLAFMSRVTMRTAVDMPCKASAMLYFESIAEACRAIRALAPLTTPDAAPDDHGARIVKAAELLDWKSLASVNDPVYTDYLAQCGAKQAEGLTAVLTETQAATPHQLADNVASIARCLESFHTHLPVAFTDCPEEYARFWAIRAGIFPSVGGTRRPGTTCLIEDVAFHIEQLPEATADLQQLIAKHGYDDACIYGHALEGNYHFIINQNFSTEAETARYEALMEDVKRLVVDKYNGSLKAEHGTGRNMAPYVRYEWGNEAYDVMCEIKALFDPKGILNPGVIFNDDPRCHLKHFKPLPLLEPDAALTGEERDEAQQVLDKVNRCIECGFCEVNCVTCGLTLSARQRIVLQREMARLRRSGKDSGRLAELERAYAYEGEATCAGDGLCATSCPMGINTAGLTHLVRQTGLPKSSFGYKAGQFVADHFAGTKQALRPVLTLANVAHCVVGTTAMSAMTRKAHEWAGLPLWTPAMPKAVGVKAHDDAPNGSEDRTVVYFPSCINQTMGLPANVKGKAPLAEAMVALMHKAGYRVVYPRNMQALCCGTIWESKGMPDIANRKLAELEEALWEASNGGRYPVVCDQSPCLHRMREHIKRMPLYEPAEFIYTFLRERLTFHPLDEVVAVHVTCSTRRMGLADNIVALAKLCCRQVLLPEGVGCCGFAGDKGFTHPEVNAYALRKLKPQIKAAGVTRGVSNSRTCEIGLTTHSGVTYESIVYLVDEATEPRAQQQA